jgi:hypothetical protein
MVDLIWKHLELHWKISASLHDWTAGARKPNGRGVLVFPPGPVHDFWIYATDGMSVANHKEPVEVFLFSPQSTESHIALLSAVAAYHQQAELLAIGHTVNFGRPWLTGSQCTYGLISTPYLDGPELEYLRMPSDPTIRFGWLIPITETERIFKIEHGLEALEQRFEKKLDYLNPRRESIIGGNAGT